MPATLALEDEIRNATKEHDELRSDAQKKWAKFDEFRNALKGNPDATNPDSDAFKAAQAANREYDETVDRMDKVDELRKALWAMSATSEERAGADPATRDRVEMVKDLAHSQSAADKILGGEAYKALKGSGALDSRQARVEANLGVAMTRDELRSHLRIEHAAVTGADDTSAGAFVTPDRKGFVPLRTRPLRLVDLITVGETDSDTVEYVEQTGFTNAAAETAEATATTGTSGTKPESAALFAVRQAAVRQIAHWIPATKRALRDAGQLRTLIEGLLRLGLDLRLDQQIASGDGLGENLRGIMNTLTVGTVTKVDAAAGNTNVPETRADALHRAVTVIRLSFHEPSAIALNPNDWQDLRLMREDGAVANTATVAGTYAKGQYLLGGPLEEVTPRIWGKPVVTGAQFTDGTGLVGDFAQAVLWLREAVQILASDSHQDFFVRNLVAILAEIPAAFGVVAPAAFCKVQAI